MAIIANFSP